MKRVVLALVAALVLIALPAAAQYNEQPPATSQPSSTTSQPSSTGVATSAPMPEERTNPAVPTHSQDPGLTATGTVASWNDDEVVLRTATGLTHFKLLPSTTGSRDFKQDLRLSIDFSRNEQGVLLAKQIRLAETVEMQPPGITTPGAATAGEKVESATENVGEAVEEGVEETLQADVDNDNKIGTRGGTSGTEPATTTTTNVDTSTSLPATGSNSPLIALLGLAALGAAAGIRRLY